ncbi:MAG: GGDEF domain-containing protein [Rhodospirillales bacterium]|nr:GGDEF domain-containing protein [Rhodospirillales bacterium]
MTGQTTSEEQDQTVEVAKSALDRMAEQGISADPTNFTVWYGYYSGTNPELNRTLDLLINHDVEFTDKLSEEIYAKFFGAEEQGDEIRAASKRIQEAVNEIVDCLYGAGEDQSTYVEKLAQFSKQLESTERGEEVGDLVRGMLEETRHVLEKNRTLESRLGESTQEIDELRQHLEEVRREAMTDPLTGMANRKFFDLTLRAEAKMAMERGVELCLLLMDIDHFKQFNDTYGHRVGDEVLKIVARTLKENVKGQDLPARYGGEEFCVILPKTGITDAVAAATNIRHALASRKMRNRKTGDSYGSVTVSIGVAQYRPGEDLGLLVQRADQALYMAKNAGRNRVVTEPDATRPASKAS